MKLAYLQVGAGCDVGSARAPLLSHTRKTAHLLSRENSSRNAQTQHEGILGRRHVEQTVKFEAKDVIRRGRAIFVGMSDQLVPDIERILLMLPAFFLAEF